MASFKDMIPQFNPYVSQQPVEDMVKVGMMKQQQYDSNLQKIYQSMSNIAGMQIARDVDKEYLKGQMNDMSNRLRAFSAGDFSSSNLTRKVNGMVNSVARDEIVQNSVRSTMNLQNAQQMQAAYHKDGKGSPSNDWYLGKQIEAWYNNPEAGASFNATYQPYQDYKKKTLEIIKQVAEDETITEDAFHYEGNRLVIHDAITRNKLSGKSAQKLQQAIMNGLDPADWQQIQIDGQYTYSNMDGDMFKQKLVGQSGAILGDLREEKNYLEGTLEDTNDFKEKMAIQAEIEKLDSQISKTQNKFTKYINMVDEGNVEGAKAQMYTEDFIHGTAQAFSSVKRERSFKSNPFAERQFAREKLANEYSRWAQDFQFKTQKWAQEQIWKEEDWKLKKQELALKQMELTGIDPGQGGQPGSIDQDQLPEMAIGTVMNEIDQRNLRIAAKDREFTQGKPEGWLEDRIAVFEKQGYTGNPMLDEWLQERSTLADKNAREQKFINTVQGEADAIYGFAEDLIPQDERGRTFEYNGEIYTPTEIVQFNSKYNKYRTILEGGSGTGGGAAPTITYNDAEARRNLTPKEYELYLAYKARDQYGEDALTLDQKNINYHRVDLNRFNIQYNDVIGDKNDYIGTEIAKGLLVSQQNYYPFLLNTSKAKEQMAGKVNNMINSLGGDKGWPGVSEDPENIRAIIADLDQASLSVADPSSYQDRIYNLTLTDGDGNTVVLPLNETQKRSQFGGVFESSPEKSAMLPYKEMIRMNSRKSYGSTAKDGSMVTTIQNSELGPSEFPNANVYGLSGNYEVSESGKWLLKLNIYDPVSGRVLAENLSFPFTGLMDEENAFGAKNTLTDDIIFEYIYGVRPKHRITSREDVNKNLQEMTQDE